MLRPKLGHLKVYRWWSLRWKWLLLHSKCHGNITILSISSGWSFLISASAARGTYRNTAIVTVLYESIRLCIWVHILLLLHLVSVDIIIIWVIAHIIAHHSATWTYPLWTTYSTWKCLLLSINCILLLEFHILVIINFGTLWSHATTASSAISWL